jgi:hypothetical protein
MDANFIGTPGELAKPEAAVLMGLSKSGGNLGNDLRCFFTQIRRQFVRCFSNAFRKQNFDHSAPVKGLSRPTSHEDAISARAASSANAACARETPYSSKAGKSLGRNGNPRSLTICAKNMETAAVGVIPISRQISFASAANSRSIRSLICSVMHQMCLVLAISQESKCIKRRGGAIRRSRSVPVPS